MWTPGEFDAYRERWPRTPDFARPDPALTDRFAADWGLPREALDARVRAAVGDVRVVFVRGFLGNWMPGNLVAPADALVALGIRAAVAPTRTSEPVEANATRLAAQLRGGSERLLLCGHSKAGLECLWLCAEEPSIAERTVGVILSQTPRGPSAVLESLLLRQHAESAGTKRRLEEWTQRIGLRAVGAARGGRQLTGEDLSAVIRRIDATPREFPVWQTASWSSVPTTWLDSFHERLGEIRPGCAHDGQFYLEDLVWPEIPHVLLPHLDHAQPVMGGFGFDHVRYWKLLISLFCEAA